MPQNPNEGYPGASDGWMDKMFSKEIDLSGERTLGGQANRTFNEYQSFVKSMKVYPEKHAVVYPALGIAGEGGEVAEKVKKWLRGDRELDKLELLKEAGDVLWYLASLADDLGFTFQDMVDENVKKLSSRKARGVQKGDGDNR